MFNMETTQNKNVFSLFIEILVSIKDIEPLYPGARHWVNICLDKMRMRLSAQDEPSSFFLIPNGLLIMALSQK